jgi:hypothetical protein
VDEPISSSYSRERSLIFMSDPNTGAIGDGIIMHLTIKPGSSSRTYSRNPSSTWSGLRILLTVIICKYLYDILQLVVAQRGQQPHRLRELKNALHGGRVQIQRLIRSMRWRCQTVIVVRGSHTRYWASHYTVSGQSLELAFEPKKKSRFKRVN